MCSNLLRVCKNCVVALLHTIVALATEMTILRYVSASCKPIEKFLRSEIAMFGSWIITWDSVIQVVLMLILFVTWLCYGFGHTFVDRRLVEMKPLTTGDKLYYFRNSPQLKFGTIIQIMRSNKRGPSEAFAVGIVLHCDEQNEDLMVVQHLTYLNGRETSAIPKREARSYFYYPHLRAYWLESCEKGGE